MSFRAETWPAPKECIFVPNTKKAPWRDTLSKIQHWRNANDVEEEIFPRCKSWRVPRKSPSKGIFCKHEITLQVAENDLKCSQKWNFMNNRQGTKHKKIFTSAIDSRSLFAQVLCVQTANILLLRLCCLPNLHANGTEAHQQAQEDESDWQGGFLRGFYWHLEWMRQGAFLPACSACTVGSFPATILPLKNRANGFTHISWNHEW